MGYARAGFEVVGVDIKPQPRYPFEFVQADALEVLALIRTDWPWGVMNGGMQFAPHTPRQFDAIHASPPCQAYSVTKNFTTKRDHPDLLGLTRALLMASTLPWVIENVPGAPMRADYKLCGCMFDLPRLRRIRWFETSWSAFTLVHPHKHQDNVITVAGHDVPSHQRKFGRSVTLDERKAAMGIDWMGRDELGQAIPPAYTEWIGRQLLASLEAAA